MIRGIGGETELLGNRRKAPSSRDLLAEVRGRGFACCVNCWSFLKLRSFAESLAPLMAGKPMARVDCLCKQGHCCN